TARWLKAEQPVTPHPVGCKSSLLSLDWRRGAREKLLLVVLGMLLVHLRRMASHADVLRQHFVDRAADGGCLFRRERLLVGERLCHFDVLAARTVAGLTRGSSQCRTGRFILETGCRAKSSRVANQARGVGLVLGRQLGKGIRGVLGLLPSHVLFEVTRRAG